jgi:hypothetical protein
MFHDFSPDQVSLAAFYAPLQRAMASVWSIQSDGNVADDALARK